MPATKTITIADDSCLRLLRDFSGLDAPVAFTGSGGAEVYIADECDKQAIDAHTGGAYVQYSIGRYGKVFRFSYVVSGVTYAIDLNENEIGHIRLINV